MGSRGAERLDAKLLAAWAEVEPFAQSAIRAALKKPERVGAVYRGKDVRNIKTSMGYVVHSSMVTGLAVQMLEAVEWNEKGEAPKAKCGKKAEASAA